MKKITCALLATALLCVAVAAGMAADAWTCPNCGQTGNTGNFCPNCAASNPYWTCVCGQTGNTGNFCPNCARPRPGAPNAAAQAPAETATPVEEMAEQAQALNATPTPTSTPKPAITVGDIITFGHYDQDANKSNGAEEIEWVVLESNGNTVTLISKYCLDAKPYNTEWDEVTWETCTLRKWLNNDFLKAAFTAEEQAHLETVTVTADKNPEYSTSPGNNTQDKVFLLSISEVEKYFSSDSARVCKPTKKADANGVRTSNSGACLWWLRSPGVFANLAAYVMNNGSVYYMGEYVDYIGDYDYFKRLVIAVRPVVVLRLGTAIPMKAPTSTPAITLTPVLPTNPLSATPVPDNIVRFGSIENSGFSWTLDRDGTLSISGRGEMSRIEWGDIIKDIEIRAIVIGEGITSIGKGAFSGMRTVKHVTIPSTVTHIEQSAFFECSALESITIPASVTEIGESAFFESGLQTITIPGSVRSIGSDAFYMCKMLRNVVIEEGVSERSIGSEAFSNCDSLQSVVIEEGVSEIGEQAFAFCNNLKEVTLPNSLIAIGYQAFRGLDQLEKINIPGSVKYIGNEAFASTGLQTITIPGSVRSISSGAFYMCKMLRNVVIEEGVSEIGEKAFAHCYNLKEVTMPNSLTAIGNSAFQCSNQLEEVNIPGSVKRIGNEAFQYCSALTKVDLQEGIEEIGDRAFDTRSLKSLTVPEGVISIGEEALGSFLKSLSLPRSLKTIKYDKLNLDEFTFGGTQSEWEHFGIDLSYGCEWEFSDTFTIDNIVEKGHCGDNLVWMVDQGGTLTIRGQGDMSRDGKWNYVTSVNIQAVVIENGVTSIGRSAFWSMSNLKRVSIPETVTRIEDEAFSGTGLESVVIPASVTEFGNGVFKNCENLESVEFLGRIDSISESFFYKCEKLTHFDIPNSVTSIGGSAFAYTGLKSITIPGSVEDIGGSAFAYTGLKSITIPGSVKDIGGGAFSSCEALQDVSLEDGIEEIGSGAFSRCSSLKTLVLPNSVTTISASSFDYSGLETIWIPKSVKTIHLDFNKKFLDMSKMKEFYYEGTREEWIKFGVSVGKDCTKHFADCVVLGRSQVTPLPSNTEFHAYTK